MDPGEPNQIVKRICWFDKKQVEPTQEGYDSFGKERGQHLVDDSHWKCHSTLSKRPCSNSTCPDPSWGPHHSRASQCSRCTFLTSWCYCVSSFAFLAPNSQREISISKTKRLEVIEIAVKYCVMDERLKVIEGHVAFDLDALKTCLVPGLEST